MNNLFFVMGYDTKTDRFFLVNPLPFDCFEDAQDYLDSVCHSDDSPFIVNSSRVDE